MAKSSVTAVIVAKNEADIIEDALKSVAWCDQIIHIDNGSTDQTINLVKKYGGKTISTSENDFDARKNIALKQIFTPWVLYLDADERISPLLRQEIIEVVATKTEISAFQVPRKNFYLGREMKHGGWGEEKVVRLFKTQKLSGWKGVLHEQPIFEGNLGNLNNAIIHHSHRDLESMVEKTILFTEKEAQLRLGASHPKVTWWRFFRVMATEFATRFVRLSAWRDKQEGVIDGLFQIFNSFIIYARLWEMQRQKQNLPLR